MDKRAFTVWTVQRCYEALRRRDLFVSRSERWRDVRLDLLQGAEWERTRSQICRTLGRSASGSLEMENMTRQLDTAYRRVAQNLTTNPAIRIENETDLIITPLDKLDEPRSLSTNAGK